MLEPLLALRPRLSIGPRKGVFFRLAKTSPPEEEEEEVVGVGKADSLNGEARTRRILEGKAEMVGVAGRTLTDEWGDRVDLAPPALGGMAEECTLFEVEEVEEALEWVWTW